MLGFPDSFFRPPTQTLDFQPRFLCDNSTFHNQLTIEFNFFILKLSPFLSSDWNRLRLYGLNSHRLNHIDYISGYTVIFSFFVVLWPSSGIALYSDPKMCFSRKNGWGFFILATSLISFRKTPWWLRPFSMDGGLASLYPKVSSWQLI